MDSDDEICRFSFEELELFTNGFSQENFIGNTQFGKVYRGNILKNGMEAQEVTVKIWVDRGIYEVKPFQRSRLVEEVYLLGIAKPIPNMVKLIGFCFQREKYYGVVYDLKPLDTVYNLVLKDSFSWVQRMKVAVGFACFLASFRSMFALKYLVRNISPAHIMLDQDFWPILFDFGMLAVGPVSDRTTKLSGCYGYFDPCLAVPGRWSQKCDVFSLGCVLIGLIAKRVYHEEDYSSDAPQLYEWALKTYNNSKKPNCSLVHKSLMADEDFFASDGRKITKLLIRCVDNKHIDSRPTLQEVAESLLKLRIVQKHPDLVGIKHMLQVRPDEGYFIEY